MTGDEGGREWDSGDARKEIGERTGKEWKRKERKGSSDVFTSGYSLTMN